MLDAPVAALFNDPNLSETVTFYTPNRSGIEKQIRAIRVTRSTDFKFDGTTLRGDATTFKVSANDLVDGFGDPFAPVTGDIITDQTGNDFVIQGTPARVFRGLVWLVEAVPT